MTKSIEKYLSQLKKELSGCDAATVQDALSDAEEYLTTAVSSVTEGDPGASDDDALTSVVEKYGRPEEVAAAYRDIESRTPPAFARPVYPEQEAADPDDTVEPAVPDTRPFYVRFFGIIADPRAWGALLYLLFSLCTGIIYFTWAVTGISLSAGFLVLIIGLPFAALFLFSARGIALAEGRIIEALLGIRMPRRPLFYSKSMGWWPRLKFMLTDRHTWLSVVYMILHLPLGIIYFTVFVTLIALSLYGIASPVLELGFDIPLVMAYNESYYFTGWFMPFVVIGGILLLFATMHLARYAGQLHGRLAKAMLVRI